MAPFCMLMANPAPSRFPSVYFWVWLETKKIYIIKKIIKNPFCQAAGVAGPGTAPPDLTQHLPSGDIASPLPSISLLLGQDLAPTHQLLPAPVFFYGPADKRQRCPSTSGLRWGLLGAESSRS